MLYSTVFVYNLLFVIRSCCDVTFLVIFLFLIVLFDFTVANCGLVIFILWWVTVHPSSLYFVVYFCMLIGYCWKVALLSWCNFPLIIKVIMKHKNKKNCCKCKHYIEYYRNTCFILFDLWSSPCFFAHLFSKRFSMVDETSLMWCSTVAMNLMIKGIVGLSSHLCNPTLCNINFRFVSVN